MTKDSEQSLVRVKANLKPMGLGSKIFINGAEVEGVSHIEISALPGQVTQVRLTLINAEVDLTAEVDGPNLILDYNPYRV